MTAVPRQQQSQSVRRHVGGSGGSLSARMQRLLEQQRVHQDKLAALSAAGTLRPHLLDEAEAGEGAGGRGGGGGGRGGGGGGRHPGDQAGGAATLAGEADAAAGPVRGQQEVGGPTLAPPQGADDDVTCLLMHTRGPCTLEGHLLKCPVSICRLTRRAPAGGGAWAPAVAVLQSKGLAQSLGPLGERSCEFTVHRPWHELRVPGCSEPVVLVFCAMPGHITSTDGG